MNLIEIDRKEKTGIILLNSPHNRNALSSTLLNEIREALDAFAAEGRIAVIIANKTNSPVWSAGHDIAELEHDGADPLHYGNSLEMVLRKIEAYPGVVIAAITGSVWGGACDLAITCDMIIADKTATFAITPAKLGIAYNTWGVLHFINKLPLNIAKEMFFTAAPISAERALRVGLINHTVEVEEFPAKLKEIVEMIAARAPLSIKLFKEQFRALTNAATLSPKEFEHLQELRRQVFRSEDYKEGIRSFFEKRPPNFKGQ